MIVWGGDPPTSSGGLYCACPDGRIYYRDADGDGFGDLGNPRPSCDGTVGAGVVDDHSDCNDNNAAVHPGEVELCNDLDDNCDGNVDNGGSVLCDDGIDCTIDVCSVGAGCNHTINTAACHYGNTCTADICDPSSGCVHRVANIDTSGFSTDRVDGRDLVVLADAWNSCPGDPAYDAAANLDQAGCVEATDFHLFMTAFGRACP
jgi:hypothetical protein